VPEWGGWLTALARENRVIRLPVPHATLWVAAERAQQFQALSTDSEALADVLRGRLEGLGPVTQAALAAPLGLEPDDIGAALAALEVEGFALRGRFTPGSNADPGTGSGAWEWCDRRLLARIHHYTVRRLRAEIEPVAARDFLRFLFDWQRVTDEVRLEGPDAISAAVALLEGFEAPASAWETELLPARVTGYEPTWLDDMCLAGRIAWARLTSGAKTGSPVRTTPITLLARRHVAFWTALTGSESSAQRSGRAQAVLDCLRAQGALFFEELAEASGLLRPQVEEALGELVSLGMVTSDSFGGLRALLVPSDRRKPFAGGTRRRRIMSFGMEDAGRWGLMRRPTRDTAEPQAMVAATEYVARALLRRYGVVFWRLLAREAEWLPPWRDLLRVYRRLEARGEIRGGRFVAGFSGEQYALPDAVGMLREVRRRPHSGEFVSLSGADPLNLAGILTPGAKLAALTGNRLLFRDGLPVAWLAGGEVQFLVALDAATEWQARKTLLRSAAPTLLADLA
jgi:ATP-dependent Lhr-like helicase